MTMQVDVGVFSRVGAYAGAEENLLLGIDLADDGTGHRVEEIVGDGAHWSTSLSSFSRPWVMSRSIAMISRISSAGFSSGTGSATRGL